MERRKFTEYIRKNWIKAETLFGEDQYYYNPRNHRIVYTENQLRRLDGEKVEPVAVPF